MKMQIFALDISSLAFAYTSLRSHCTDKGVGYSIPSPQGIKTSNKSNFLYDTVQ